MLAISEGASSRETGGSVCKGGKISPGLLGATVFSGLATMGEGSTGLVLIDDLS